jgi:hypothetical protein
VGGNQAEWCWTWYTYRLPRLGGVVSRRRVSGEPIQKAAGRTEPRVVKLFPHVYLQPEHFTAMAVDQRAAQTERISDDAKCGCA